MGTSPRNGRLFESPSVLSFIANRTNAVAIMIYNVEIDGTDRVDKIGERSLLDSTYKRCPTSLEF